MTTDAPAVSLDLPAKPGGVGVVRQALVGLADGLALDDAVLADAKMAVTEACTNAVVHAFPGHEGRFAVDMYADAAALTVVVSDAGAGIDPDVGRSETAALGLGLALITALSDATELLGEPGAGTEVRMRFDYERSADPAAEHPITGRPGESGYWETPPPETPSAEPGS